jgi:hypothetical protein
MVKLNTIKQATKEQLKQLCQVQNTLNRKKLPTKLRWEKASYVWFSIRDNDRQLPLIENHTQPNNKEKQNIENEHRLPTLVTPWPNKKREYYGQGLTMTSF